MTAGEGLRVGQVRSERLLGELKQAVSCSSVRAVVSTQALNSKQMVSSTIMDSWNKIPRFRWTHAQTHIDPSRKGAPGDLTDVSEIIQLQRKGGSLGGAFAPGTLVIRMKCSFCDGHSKCSRPRGFSQCCVTHNQPLKSM